MTRARVDLSPRRPPRILPLIVAAQFAGTSLWFVGNAALDGLDAPWAAMDGAVGWLTSSVQLGFIVGTLSYAFTGVADRFRGHWVFFVSASAAALSNLAALAYVDVFAWFLCSRVATGFFLAGVYPVGMKLAASWYERGLGSAIGLLVGALVLGTASPYLLKIFAVDALTLVLVSSALALAGGLAILRWVPEGPHTRLAADQSWRAAWSPFAAPGFRAAALGYFGHMWELYAFWAFAPFAVALVAPGASPETAALWAFAIIGGGSVACAVGGHASTRRGSAVVAGVALAGSGLCAIASPMVFLHAPAPVALAFLVVWGMLVVADSPQFSALAARSAPPERVGTGLTLMNAIGFAVTIPSIELLATIEHSVPSHMLFLPLACGPALGAAALVRLLRDDPTRPGRAG